MSIGEHLPIQFYELAFVLAFILVPLVALRGEIENYAFGMMAMYFCMKIIKQRRNKQLPAEGRAVLVSGCDSGFGHLEAIKLDGLGYKVFAGCLYPEGEGAQKLKTECSDRLHVLHLDITSEESVKRAGESVRNNLADCCLWALVNNAGIYGHGDIELCRLDTYEQLMDVNCFGAIRLTQELLPLIRQSKGRVVIVSGIMSLFTWPCASAYSASKMALECFGDSLRMEMKKFGVGVSIVEPAMFAGNTDVHSEQNITRYYKDIDASWDTLSDDVKSTYPKTYMTNQIGALIELKKSYAAKSPDAVIDALTEAVTNSIPKYRYAVHGGPFPVDLLAVYGFVHKFLPEYVSDWILCKVTGHADQGLIKMASDKTNGHVTKQD